MTVAPHTAWPNPGRLRELLLDGEHRLLTDSELLALLLCDLAEDGLAEALIAAFGSLRKLLEAPPRALLGAPGVDASHAARLKAVLPLASRYVAGCSREDRAFPSSDDTVLFLGGEYAGVEREVFGCVFLDAKNRLIRFEKLFFGTVDQSAVFPREVAKAALRCNAAAVILAHNHPSGCGEPSMADIDLTQRLVSVLGELDVRVLDHVIVGANRTVSMAERQLLGQPWPECFKPA